MDALKAYHSESEDDDPDSLSNVARRLPLTVNAAPAISLTAGRPMSNAVVPSSQPQPARAPVGDLILYNNPPKSVMYKPLQGPQHEDPTRQKKTTATIRPNVAVDEITFAQERTNFQRSGRAAAPTATGEIVLRTTLGYTRERLARFASQDEQRPKRARQSGKDDNLVQGSDDEAEYGVWGPPGAEEQWSIENAVTDLQKGTLAPEQEAERAYFVEKDRQRGLQDTSKEEESAQERLVERKMAHLLPPKRSQEAAPVSTEFHGDTETDYKGHSWTAPPSGLGGVRADGAASDHPCFVPKQCVHRFAHNSNPHNKIKGVQRIRLFPVTGHLLLSAGLDGTCKVWSVPAKKLMRTYLGHTAAVRDVQFNHDGSRFLSASFDRYLRLWETSSGAVVQTFSNSKVPYVVQFYPHDDNFFVVGCSDNKIVTYDATTAQITQEYNHHLAPVNAILFAEDNGTKMVTSSDDKTILVWEWDIGVPIKYISDPSMHSMPCLVMHPSLRFFVGQSLDNTIAVFQANNKFALQKKKIFSGHIVSGYACEMSFSPDGQFLASGDGNGNFFFWDWKRHKILQKFRAHTGGPAIACVWHPLEPSVVFTCGWDGNIKIWK